MHDEGEPVWSGNPSKLSETNNFEGGTGVADIVLDCEEPVEFFKLVMTKELIALICFYTNNYADQEIKKASPLPKRSRLHKRKPVTSDEMYLYLCLVLFRGIVWKATMESYYAKDDVFTTPFITKI